MRKLDSSSLRHPERRAPRATAAEGQFLNSVSLLDQTSRLIISSLLYRLNISEEFFAVYIFASKIGHLYIGVTNNLIRRTTEHLKKVNKGFAQEKDCVRLVYFELHDVPLEAIGREKQIKRWRREKKERLISDLNPPWIDLSPLLTPSLLGHPERSEAEPKDSF
jgi:putative endonuclease